MTIYGDRLYGSASKEDGNGARVFGIESSQNRWFPMVQDESRYVILVSGTDGHDRVIASKEDIVFRSVGSADQSEAIDTAELRWIVGAENSLAG